MAPITSGSAAVGAMFTTSFTTAIAFIATASSPVMPISAFGYFAACTVIMNYTLVMTVFPCLLLVWHKTGSKSACCCSIPGFGNVPSEEGGKGAFSPGAVSAEDQMRALERFFVNIYSPLIQGPARFGFIGVFFVMFVFFGYFAMQMEPPVDPEQWFPNDHMLTKLGIQNTLYIGGNEDRYVGGKLVWGITGVERGDEFNRWVPDKRGSAVFDPSFDLSTAAAQDFYQATCDRFRTEACAVVGCMDGTSMLTRPGEVSCFIEDWRAWYTSQSCGVCEDDPAAPFLASGATCASLISSGTVTCTTDLVTVHAIATPGLATIADHCQATCAVCDVVAGDTCHTTVVFPTGPAFVESLIAFRSDPVYFFRWGDQIGVIGNQLKYVTINFVSTLQHDNPQVTTRTMYELLEKIVGEQNVAAPAGMKGLYHCDGGVCTLSNSPEALCTVVWVVRPAFSSLYCALNSRFAPADTWMETQKGLVDNVFQGFSICFPAAFIVSTPRQRAPICRTDAVVIFVSVSVSLSSPAGAAAARSHSPGASLSLWCPSGSAVVDAQPADGNPRHHHHHRRGAPPPPSPFRSQHADHTRASAANKCVVRSLGCWSDCPAFEHADGNPPCWTGRLRPRGLQVLHGAFSPGTQTQHTSPGVLYELVF